MPPSLLQPIIGSFDPAEIVRGLEQLPATPAILPRLLRLLDSDSASLDEVIDLIRVDLSITARILQMGSSAYYHSAAGPCENVSEAVNRVGFNQVYKLVSYAATAQLLMRPLAAYNIATNDTGGGSPFRAPWPLPNSWRTASGSIATSPTPRACSTARG